MRKRISILLHKLASKICPSIVYTFDEEVLYEPKVCTKSYIITKKNVKDYKKSENISSSRQALAKLKEEVLGKAKKDVMNAIESRVMEQRIYKVDDYIVVEVRVNSYVPKEKE